MHSAWLVCLGCVYLEEGEGFAYYAIGRLLKLVKSVLLLLSLASVAHGMQMITCEHHVGLYRKGNHSLLLLFTFKCSGAQI